jgi:uncharacterized protein YbcI
MNTQADPRGQGQALAEVSNSIVKLLTECYGRGPTRAKTYCFDNYVITVFEDFLTTVERTLVARGRRDLVREVRLTFQEEMADKFKGAVTAALGRQVVTYQSQLTFDPAIGFEIFVLAPEEAPAP